MQHIFARTFAIKTFDTFLNELVASDGFAQGNGMFERIVNHRNLRLGEQRPDFKNYYENIKMTFENVMFQNFFNRFNFSNQKKLVPVPGMPKTWTKACELAWPGASTW